MLRLAWVLTLASALAATPVGAKETAQLTPAADNEGATDVQRKDGSRASELGRRPGERRPDDPFSVTLFDRPLVIGGEYVTRFRSEQGYGLGTDDDGLLRLRNGLKLELLYELRSDAYLFLEGAVAHKTDLWAEDGQEDAETVLVRGQSWLLIEDIRESGWSLQAGRLNLREKREWWWDQDLDAARLLYERGPFSLSLAVAQELAPRTNQEDHIDPEQEDLLRFLGRATWKWGSKNRIEAFGLVQYDRSSSPAQGDLVDEDREDESDADLTWLGLRAMGRWKPRSGFKFYYWIDTGFVTGSETVFDFGDAGGGKSVVDERFKHDVQGWALDVGITWQTKLPADLRVTLGYAIGSGDDEFGPGKDRAFRQTGLQDNNAKFRGVDRFRYYGELFRPELSNLQISSLALGVPLFERSSLELVYHHYRQVEAADFLRDAEIDFDPLGHRRNIGHELDLVLGLEEWTHLEIEAVASVFRAGSAFGPQSGETATLGVLKIEWNF